MDQWFTSPTLLGQLWVICTKALSAVIADKRKVPEETLSKKQKV
jgi:hypothetical protein